MVKPKQERSKAGFFLFPFRIAIGHFTAKFLNNFDFKHQLLVSGARGMDARIHAKERSGYVGHVMDCLCCSVRS